MLNFYGEELLAHRPTPKLKDHLLSPVRDWLFSTVVSILHIWRSLFLPSTWGRTWRRGTRL